MEENPWKSCTIVKLSVAILERITSTFLYLQMEEVLINYNFLKDAIK